ncbi:hypothetical protein [Sphingomonas hylomeconis]|uniref:Uncharacterized protein n=1 Tax=Sphingomonas hylomeconis TaxID=1395958 RepID=A0ABV7SYE0_9SPHN
MTALTLTLTNAGRAALVNAGAGGTAAVIVARAGLTATAFVSAPTLTVLPGEFKRIDAIAGQAVDAMTVHLAVRDESSDAYAVRGIGFYLADGTLFATYSQATPIMEKADVSTFYVAADLRFLDGTAQLVQFGNTNFLNPPASEGVAGVTRLATLAEALAGLVANKTITPATMKAVLASYVRTDQLGLPGGPASLGPDGKLLLAQRPAVDLIDVFGVASQAAMLALAATPGDFAVRADNGRVYVLQQAPATTLANWLEISTPAPVSSVNNKVGTIVLVPADIGAAPATRLISTTGLVTGGGSLGADRTLDVPAASRAEAEAGLLASKALTPDSISGIIQWIQMLVPPARSITGAGLARGGGSLATDRVIEVLAASAAEIVAGIVSDKAVTPAGLAGLPQSLTPNGYIMLPGGFLIQWLQVRQIFTSEVAITVSYPIAFQSVVLPIVAMGYIEGASGVRDLYPQRAGPGSLTSQLIQLQSDDARDTRLEGFDLIVMGK